MLTIEKLLNIALEAESKLAPQVPGQSNSGNYDLRHLARKAMIAAEHLEKIGLAEIANIGCFETIKPQKGQKVRIKAGARRFSTNPQVPQEGEEVKRAYPIKVHDFHPGYITEMHDKYNKTPYTIGDGTVHWVGTGSYWYWANINDIDLID